MRRVSTAVMVAALAVSTNAVAQEGEGEGKGKGEVIIPSELELTDQQKADLQKSIEIELASALKECVAIHPRPEFFTSLVVEYRLKKSGKLTGGYLGGAAPESSLYVKTDEERAKLEEEGAFARLVVRNDKDLERCMKKQTGKADSGLSRYSAAITGTFDIAWNGKTPKLTASQFEVKKEK